MPAPATRFLMAGLELVREGSSSLWVEFDEEDLPLIEGHQWRVHKGRVNRYFYAVTYARWPDGRERTLGMHVLLMGQPGVDHIDLNGLNNRRSNLRLATPSQNAANRPKQTGPYTSQYKGVSWHQAANKWRASIRVNGVRTHLGVFTDERQAAEAYDRAAYAAWGDFSLLNEESAWH